MNSRRSLKIILSNAKVNDWVKEHIKKKLKTIVSLPNSPDSQPADYYRYFGQQTLRLQLIHELNDFINEHTNNYHSIKVWSEELWNLKENCESLIKLTNKMLRGLLQHGIQNGFYEPLIEENVHE